MRSGDRHRRRAALLLLLAFGLAGSKAVAERPERTWPLTLSSVPAEADIIRIPLPVPVPVPARRPGSAPLDAREMQAWREERAMFLARARMAALPAPQAPVGMIVDASITPPVPRRAQRPSSPAFIMPFENGRISSMFNRGRVHPAIDLAGRLGSPVLATSSGQTVTQAGWYGGYGNAVIARDAEGRTHLYGHLLSVRVRVGEVMAQGQQLGTLGSTGYSTGPHVHYEVKDARGRHMDPASLLFPGRTLTAGYTWEGTGFRATNATASASTPTNR